jgi:glycosyltransferase involved in cell wall biosynthesis
MLRPLKHKRRVLMTVDAIGGVWRYALDLAAELSGHDCEIVLAGLGPQPSAAQRTEAERIGTVEWLDTPLDWMTEREADLDTLPAEIDRLVRRYAIDLVHLNAPSQAYGMPPTFPVVAVSHSCVVTWFHAVRHASLPRAWAWQKQRNRCGFDRADVVIAPSASHAALIERCYGAIGNLEVVRNSVHPALMSAPTREPLGFAAGRWWDEGKNARTLEAAAARCTWPILAAGPVRGPNGAECSFQAVRGLGELPGGEVRSLMASTGIFVSPSVFEPFGLAAVEAAEAETPLLLADIPTYRELWDGAAMFFPPRDAAALADAFNLLAADGRLRQKLGAAARQRALNYSPDRQTARMLSIYDAARAPAMAEA